MSYLIERDSAELTRQPGRVYVTGPHAGRNIWSSTYDPAEAATWVTRTGALEQAHKRSWRNCRVIPQAEAPVLPTLEKVKSQV